MPTQQSDERCQCIQNSYTLCNAKQRASLAFQSYLEAGLTQQVEERNHPGGVVVEVEGLVVAQGGGIQNRVAFINEAAEKVDTQAAKRVITPLNAGFTGQIGLMQKHKRNGPKSLQTGVGRGLSGNRKPPSYQ